MVVGVLLCFHFTSVGVGVGVEEIRHEREKGRRTLLFEGKERRRILVVWLLGEDDHSSN